MGEYNKLLTVTIPAYQVEKYIVKTIESLLQPEILDEIEILIINDGSRDGTESISKHYEELYPNTVKVITKDNGGHGSTINVGIGVANGKYFKVIDGDDWVEAEGIVQLLQSLRCIDSDMIVNPFIKESDITGKRELVTFDEAKYKNTVIFDEMYCKSKRLYMHAITFRTELLQSNSIHIDEKTFYVDIEYILYPIPYVETIQFLDFPVYVYRTFSEHQSMCRTNMQAKRQQHKQVLFSLIDFYNDKAKGISCKKREYILVNIAMMAMLQYKIILSLPNTCESKIEMQDFDRELKNKSEEIYKSCFGLKMWALRHFGNICYFPFAMVVKKDELE